MEWTTLLATLLGAGVATGTSLLVEARKDHRDVTAEWRTTRRDLYAAYLAVLTQARSELRHLTTSRMPRAKRSRAARKTFARCYELRYQVELFAPKEVVTAALDYFRRVRDFRNAVDRGLRPTDQEFEEHTEAMKVTLAAARTVMRKDLDLPDIAGGGTGGAD